MAVGTGDIGLEIYMFAAIALSQQWVSGLIIFKCKKHHERHLVIGRNGHLRSIHGSLHFRTCLRVF